MVHTIYYPDLKIVPLSHLKLQEYVQQGRMDKLAQTIKKEGILRNPPIVTNFSNDTYLHLDGANRITAVALLKYPSCLVQIVDYSDPTQVRLTSWSHVTRVDKDQFLASIQKLPDVTFKQVQAFNHRVLLRPHMVCIMQCTDGSVFEVTAKTSFAQLVKCIGNVVDLYGDTPVERVFSESPWTSQSIHVRFDRYAQNNVFLAFPTFSPQQVITLVEQGVLMPAGLTRHVVYRRKLNVNLPLTYLKIKSIEKANVELQKFLGPRTVRLYEEPVIYFE